MGFRTPTDGPHCAMAKRKTLIALLEMTIERLADRGKNVKSHVNREIIGGYRTINKVARPLACTILLPRYPTRDPRLRTRIVRAPSSTNFFIVPCRF
jgi:hypothetical protein